MLFAADLIVACSKRFDSAVLQRQQLPAPHRPRPSIPAVFPQVSCASGGGHVGHKSPTRGHRSRSFLANTPMPAQSHAPGADWRSPPGVRQSTNSAAKRRSNPPVASRHHDSQCLAEARPATGRCPRRRSAHVMRVPCGQNPRRRTWPSRHRSPQTTRSSCWWNRPWSRPCLADASSPRRAADDGSGGCSG